MKRIKFLKRVQIDHATYFPGDEIEVEDSFHIPNITEPTGKFNRPSLGFLSEVLVDVPVAIVLPSDGDA